MSGQSSRQMVVDEMFPDGPGNLDYVDAEDGVRSCDFPFSILEYNRNDEVQSKLLRSFCKNF